MNVIVGCEVSGIIRDEFIKRGHDAWSCDLKPSKNNSPYHIQDDILYVIKHMQFDLGIFHPPCTYLCVTRNKWFNPKYNHRFPDQQQKRKEAIDFFIKIANCGIPRTAIENPVGIMSTEWRQPDQIIQPFQYGHVEPKKTCLWLKNLPVLKPTEFVTPEYHVTKSLKRLPKWYAYADKSEGQEMRAEIRSNTFLGVAEAMADQWQYMTRIIHQGNLFDAVP